MNARRRLMLQTAPSLTYVIGDVHGCLDLFDRLETEICADAQAKAPSAPVLIVLVGDLVDRGPHSAGVMDRVIAPPPTGHTALGFDGQP